MKHPNENSDRDQQLDQLLDRALVNYTNAEPRSGLEDRILANLNSQPRETTTSWLGWRWLSLGAAFAALVIAVIFLRPTKANHSRDTQTANTVAPNSVAPTVAPNPKLANPQAITHSTNNQTPALSANNPRKPAILATRTSPKPRTAQASDHRQIATAAAAVPHQAVFPAPIPLSEQERLLLRYLDRTPKNVLVAMSEEQKQHQEELDQQYSSQPNQNDRPIEQKSRFIDQEGNSK